MKNVWTINEAAEMTHLSKDTIRYYEKEKLIFPRMYLKTLAESEFFKDFGGNLERKRSLCGT